MPRKNQTAVAQVILHLDAWTGRPKNVAVPAAGPVTLVINRDGSIK